MFARVADYNYFENSYFLLCSTDILFSRYPLATYLYKYQILQIVAIPYALVRGSRIITHTQHKPWLRVMSGWFVSSHLVREPRIMASKARKLLPLLRWWVIMSTMPIVSTILSVRSSIHCKQIRELRKRVLVLILVVMDHLFTNLFKHFILQNFAS